MTTTKIYKNTTQDAMTVVGIGEILAGEQVSITTEHQPAVILENYPGLLDITDVPTEEQSPLRVNSVDQLLDNIVQAQAEEEQNV